MCFYRKDQCDSCTGYSMGTIGEDKYQMHITRKKMARAEKKKQKELAITNPSTLMFTMDVQAVLTAPRLQVSVSYYL